MDNKKLAKLIDEIVKLRLKKILKSESFNNLIKERVSKEVVNLLLESNASPKQTSHSSKKTTPNLTSLLKEKEENKYPRLPKNGRRLSKDSNLNNILNQTANDRSGMARFNKNNRGNDLIDLNGSVEEYMMGGGVGPMEGSLRSELSQLGIDPSKISNLDDLEGDINIDMAATEEDMLSEGIDQIDVDNTIQAASQNDRYAHLVNAFTKDYSDVMQSIDEKVKINRPAYVSMYAKPGKPVSING